MRGYLPVRGTDSQGSGHYGASRGSRTHQGIDFACEPGTGIYPIYPGTVTKIGLPYADKPEFKYIQVSDEVGLEHRYFYVYPRVKVGDVVNEQTVIGFTQKLPYSDITQHCHYEIKKDGKHIDPRPYLK